MAIKKGKTQLWKEGQMSIKKSPTQLWEEGKISDNEFWNSSDMIPLSEAIEQGLLNPSPSEDQVVEEIGQAMIVEALDSF